VAGLWGLIAACAAGSGAAFPAAALVGLWPSHAYYTSQALKEAATLLALALAPMLFCRALGQESAGRRNAFAAGGAAAGLFLALLRPYLLPPLGLAVAAATLTALWGRTLTPAAAALLILSGLAPMAGYKPLKVLLQRPVTTESRYESTDILPRVSPASPFAPGLATPQGLADYRARLMTIARDWSERATGRPIDTLIFPDAQLNTWPRLLAFLPKASFYALFMPLPGLYPMDGKLGRMLSAAEGLVLLTLFGLALRGLGRSPPRPAGVLLAAFFVLAVPAASFVEFDLGSASRHRLQYLPFLFPFAAAELVRRRGAP
jgi:hypothetical protein